MPYFTYILRSESSGRYYVGHAEDTSIRLSEHNRGCVVSTRNRGPWVLFYREEFATRAEAARRERYIKAMKSRKWIEELAGASR